MPSNLLFIEGKWHEMNYFALQLRSNQHPKLVFAMLRRHAFEQVLFPSHFEIISRSPPSELLLKKTLRNRKSMLIQQGPGPSAKCDLAQRLQRRGSKRAYRFHLSKSMLSIKQDCVDGWCRRSDSRGDSSLSGIASPPPTSRKQFKSVTKRTLL